MLAVTFFLREMHEMGSGLGEVFDPALAPRPPFPPGSLPLLYFFLGTPHAHVYCTPIRNESTRLEGRILRFDTFFTRWLSAGWTTALSLLCGCNLEVGQFSLFKHTGSERSKMKVLVKDHFCLGRGWWVAEAPPSSFLSFPPVPPHGFRSCHER